MDDTGKNDLSEEEKRELREICKNCTDTIGDYLKKLPESFLSEKSLGIILISYDPANDINKVASTYPAENLVSILEDVIETQKKGVFTNRTKDYMRGN